MRRFWLLFSQAVTVLLAAYFVVATLQPDWVGRGSRLSRATGVSLVEAPASPGGLPPRGSAGPGAAYAQPAGIETLVGALRAGVVVAPLARQYGLDYLVAAVLLAGCSRSCSAFWGSHG